MPMLHGPPEAKGTLLCGFQHPRPEYGPRDLVAPHPDQDNPVAWSQIKNHGQSHGKAITAGEKV
jgi:hypothetical protein